MQPTNFNDFEYHRQVLVALRYALGANPENAKHWAGLIEETNARITQPAVQIIFRSPYPSLFEIGENGTGIRQYLSDLVGLSPAWMAIAHGSSPISNWTSVDAANASNSIRDSIHGPCARWAESIGCRPLANVLRGLKVEADVVRYNQRKGDPLFTCF